MLNYNSDRNSYASGKLPPAEYISKIINQIRRDEKNIFISSPFVPPDNLNFDNKLPLSGMALAVKDNISTMDFPTTCASEILRDFTPVYNATAIDNIKTAGAIIVGKTNMDEFAMGCTSEFSAFGAVAHPDNRNQSPGGSSGGSAAAVRSGIVHAALGSDTGGSVRQPAALCGVCGFKPTYGRISRHGLIAFASSLDQIGIIAPDIQSIEKIFDIIKGRDENDATTINDIYESGYSGTDSIKIGFLHPDGGLCSAEIMHTYTNAISRISCEFECEKVELRFLKYSLPAYHIISSAEASSNLSRYDGRRFGKKPDNHDFINYRTKNFGREVKRRIMLGAFVLSEGYSDKYFTKAQKVRRKISDEYSNLFAAYDCILTPTVPFDIIPQYGIARSRINAYYSDYYTSGPSLAGLPAITIPIGGDIYSGLQLIGPQMADERLLETAENFHRLFHKSD
jgi:aspartyl-tRNA(Asn)/glutamyl-tRNA(Gln) amidotransferase subunit A